jgi:hypothetical protein
LVGIRTTVNTVAIDKSHKYNALISILFPRKELAKRINKSGKKVGPNRESLFQSNKFILAFEHDKFAIKLVTVQITAEIIRKKKIGLDTFCPL